jgi:phenylpropionate dioxygenase-like ring-hydroxylating dioxygenase large terminal subunit
MTRAREFSKLSDIDKGVVDRRVFYDPEIYQLELEQIFARSWNFMCHESQIKDPGDFFLSFIGEDRVIIVRNNDGGVSVLVNSCRHRGNAVCRAEEGHATSFMCTYHGWTYDLKGSLVGVPGFKEVYHEELDRESWGLITAAQVETYKGFVFANMDPEAPGLQEWLGDARFAFDFFADRAAIEVAPGVAKFAMKSNWKFPGDNSTDQYHAFLTHASARLSGYTGGGAFLNRRQMSMVPQPQKGFTVLCEYGHGYNASYLPEGWQERVHADVWGRWRLDPEVSAKMGPLANQLGNVHMNLFPNLFLVTSGFNLALRIPKGPTSCEIWMWSFQDSTATAEDKKLARHRSGHHFGPSGLMEQDDGENWDQSTAGARGTISKRYPLNLQLKLNEEVIFDEEAPPRVPSHMTESAQRWTHRCWSDFMAAESWDDLRAHHATPADHK